MIYQYKYQQDLKKHYREKFPQAIYSIENDWVANDPLIFDPDVSAKIKVGNEKFGGLSKVDSGNGTAGKGKGKGKVVKKEEKGEAKAVEKGKSQATVEKRVLKRKARTESVQENGTGKIDEECDKEGIWRIRKWRGSYTGGLLEAAFGDFDLYENVYRNFFITVSMED